MNTNKVLYLSLCHRTVSCFRRVVVSWHSTLMECLTIHMHSKKIIHHYFKSKHHNMHFITTTAFYLGMYVVFISKMQLLLKNPQVIVTQKLLVVMMFRYIFTTYQISMAEWEHIKTMAWLSFSVCSTKMHKQHKGCDLWNLTLKYHHNKMSS